MCSRVVLVVAFAWVAQRLKVTVCVSMDKASWDILSFMETWGLKEENGKRFCFMLIEEDVFVSLDTFYIKRN